MALIYMNVSVEVLPAKGIFRDRKCQEFRLKFWIVLY